MGNVFAYARVSTPRQGERGVSLPEQRAAIEQYTAIHGLTITRWFEERESAAKRGRGVFAEMLRLLRLKVAQGVVIHKIDRSARNLGDWTDVGKLVDAGVDVYFASENVDLRSVAGRLSADIQAVVAAHYSRNLREEVKKGLYGRLKQGFYPFRAPIGYLDQGSAKMKVPDPKRAPYIRTAFTMYATGRYSLPVLAKEMHRRGLQNRTGGIVSVNGLAAVLANLFYVGLIRINRNGQTYEGGHEPLVSAQVFKAVQEVLAGKRTDRIGRSVFLYSRIVRCASCGYSLIAERHKGHIYYRCHNRPFKDPAECPPTSIREEAIDRAVIAVLTDVDLSGEELAIAQTMLAKRKAEAEADRTALRQALLLKQDGLRQRIAKLTDLLVDGVLDKDLFGERRDALLLEQVQIKDELALLERDAASGLATTLRTVELAKSPSTLFKMASLTEKRNLLKMLLSNLIVAGKNVEITLALPFRLIAERDKTPNGGACRGACRTWEEIINGLITQSTIKEMSAM